MPKHPSSTKSSRSCNLKIDGRHFSVIYTTQETNNTSYTNQIISNAQLIQETAHSEPLNQQNFETAVETL